MKQPQSMFSLEALEREKEQQSIEAQIGIRDLSNRKVRMNINLPADYKEKLIKEAKKRHVSASVLIELWIDEHCV